MDKLIGAFKQVREILRTYPPLYDALVTAGIIAGAWILAKVGVIGVSWLTARLTARTRSKLYDYIIAALRAPLVLFILVSGIDLALERLRIRKYQFIVDYWKQIGGLLFILGVVVVIFGVIRVLTAVLTWYSERLEERHGHRQFREFIPLVDKIAKILLSLIGLITILAHFQVDVSSLVMTLGVGGLAIGLALQDTLANIFAGITIMVDRPFRINDRITVPSGEVGDVVAIGMRSTKIRTLDNMVLVIPNKTLVENKVINHAYPDARIRLRLNVGVAYGTDIEKAKKLVTDVASSHPLVLKTPSPQVYLMSFGESSLDLLLICWINDYSQTWAVTDSVNMEINKAFKHAGIEIPFPHRTLYLRQEQPLEIRDQEREPEI